MEKIGKCARLVLTILLPFLDLALITVLISYLMDREATPLYARYYYGGILEYIFASLAIIVGGALLAQIAEYDRSK